MTSNLHSYVFRKPVRTEMGFQMSEEPMKKGMMTQLIHRIGELSGFEYNTISYSLRYMAGNNMDRNGMF